MSRPTFGRLVALERLLKDDAIMLPRYRQAGGMGIIMAKAMNAPHDFVRTDTAYVLDLDFLPGLSAHAKLLEVGGATIVDDGALVSAAVTSIVSKDSDATTLDTYAIPAAVQALTGYGWSAGTAYNYVDFDAKKYIQRVASVDLGTLRWTYQSGSGTDRWYSGGITSAAKAPASADDKGNILCAPYATDTFNRLTTHAEDKVISLGTNKNLQIYDSAKMSMTRADFEASLSGVMLDYELATPVETDISAYLTGDNMMRVESGGTLKFENSNQIPVPSKIEYVRRA